MSKREIREVGGTFHPQEQIMSDRFDVYHLPGGVRAWRHNDDWALELVDGTHVSLESEGLFLSARTTFVVMQPAEEQ